MKAIQIRQECKKDYKLVEIAFKTVPYSDQTEPFLVACLHQSDVPIVNVMAIEL